MLNYRKPAVSGYFYPNDKKKLQKEVQNLLAQGEEYLNKKNISPYIFSNSKGIIAPHAGYIYSGKVAGIAYTALKKVIDKTKINNFLILGPPHRTPVETITVCPTAGYLTPLGAVKTNPNLLQRAKLNPLVEFNLEPHILEHSIETQIPFLQEISSNATILTALIGSLVTPHQVAKFIKNIIKDDTLIIISSDLSHYHPPAECKKIDARTCQIIEDLEIDKLNTNLACGSYAIKGIMQLAKENLWNIKTLACYNSADFSPNAEETAVGYGAYLIYS